MELFAKFLNRTHNKVRYQIVGTRQAMDALIEEMKNTGVWNAIQENNLLIYHMGPEIMHYLTGESIICDADKLAYIEYEIVPLVKDSNAGWRLDTATIDNLQSKHDTKTQEGLVALMDEFSSIVKQWADAYKTLEVQNLIVHI